MRKLIYSLGLLPVLAFAQNSITSPPTQLPNNTTVNNVSGVKLVICGLIGWFFWVLIIFSILMVLRAGWKYISSKGDPKVTSEAGKMILYAIIGVAVALLAKGLPNLVNSFIGGNMQGTPWCA